MCFSGDRFFFSVGHVTSLVSSGHGQLCVPEESRRSEELFGRYVEKASFCEKFQGSKARGHRGNKVIQLLTEHIIL